MDKYINSQMDIAQTAFSSENNMKSTKANSTTSRGISRWLIGALLACLPGLTFAAVTIDQTPLVVQKPLPPNIVLMLDDSGSMAGNIMPDKKYLSTQDLDKGLRNSSVNGIYYDPTVTYLPAVKSDGVSYGDSSFPDAYHNPFESSPRSTDNIKNWSGDFDFYDKTGSGSGKKYAFAFTVQSGNSYTYYHVSDNCTSSFSHCYPPTDTSGVVAPLGVVAGTNVANWYSYYRTRLLTAKTGLMNAFANLDPAYRVGFGSIDGSNYDGLGSSVYPFNTEANGYTYKTGLAQVATFNATQKAAFWSWLVGINTSTYRIQYTPLRAALDHVGQYYKTSQPWESTDVGSPLSCRQSYTILTTDGFWNGGEPSSEVLNASNIDGPQITTPSPYQYQPKAPYSGGKADSGASLADVAMYYWEHDLRPLSNDVPTTPNDPAFWQHMTTFTVGLGFDPVGIKPSGTTVSDIFGWANSGAAVPSDFAWPTPASDSQNNIADLAHAALNGHGAFFSAKNPQAFEQGIAAALAATSAQLGANNALAVDSSTLTAGSSLSFSATYYTAQWTGQLLAKKADANGDYTVSYWNAAAALPAYGARKIQTTTPVKQGNSSTATAIDFTAANAGKFPASLADAGIANTTVSMASMVNYLRGDTEYDTTNPGGTLRARKSLIGDIVHSSPIYVPAPSATAFSGRIFDGSTTYAQFVTDEAARQPVVYVAANDGMLHAFAVNAFTDSKGNSIAAGQELYAFIPGALLRQTGDASLGRLANPQYGIANKADGSETIPHQYYNDGELTVASAYLNKAWHTILVGTTGLGTARAVYALDVTDPTNITFLWERAADDGNKNSDYIGQMTGKPIIAEVPDGNKSEWVVLMGNGANSTNGTAGLLQFDLATGDLKVYTTNSTTDNALAAPAVWQASGTDNLSTDAYAGDLLGNVWHFSLSGGSTDGSGSTIYIAKDANNKPQPITAGMTAAYNPNDGSRWIFFGTGKYQTATDVKTTDPQTWYGLRVYSANTSLATVTDTMDRTNLMQRTIVAQQQTANGSISRATSTAGPSENMQAKAGWYLDLAYPADTTKGERIINPSQIIGGYLFVSTLIPSATDLCNPYPSGAIMAVDPFTGANPGVPIQDTNGDGKIDAGDAVDGVFFNAKLLDVALGGMLTAQTTPSGITIAGVDLKGNPTGGVTNPNTGAFSRLSWREILNQ